MTFILCNHNRRRGITNGAIPLFLGRDQWRPIPPIILFEVMIQKSPAVGFFAYQQCVTPSVSFIAETPIESILFFNISHTEEEVVIEENETILFFNVSEEEVTDLPEAGGTIRFFNVFTVDNPIPIGENETILFFNVSEEEVC